MNGFIINNLEFKMKGKSINKKAATPVILVDESEPLSNTVIISKLINMNDNSSIKPSSNVFSGGFKYRPQQPKISNNISKLNPSKIDKMTVYDEFGIINDSIGKKKYREEKQQPEKNNQLYTTVKSLSSSNPWKKESKDIVTNNYVDPSNYEISKLKSREQNAIHVKSSLQVINLENIEAKLEAHRQSMKPLEQQYNIAKGKSTIQPVHKERLRFNIDVDKQYNEIQPTRIYELIKDGQQKMQRPQQDVIMEELWEQKKRNDPKLADYDFKYQQYLVEKQAKKMIGSVVKDSLFTWDKYATKQDLEKRKVAKQHKSKQKSYGQAVQSKVIDRSQNKSLSPSKQPQQDKEDKPLQESSIEERIASKDDKFIGKFIMAEIDVDKKGMISKDELADYLNVKEHLIKGYHIDLKWLHTDLDNFQTKRKGMLNQTQIIQFLATLDSLHHPQIVLKQVGKQKPKREVQFQIQREKDTKKVYTSSYKENASKFQRVFAMLDISDDKIIKREEFLQNVFIDAECNKILDKNVIIFNLIDKSITFRQILSYILEDYRKQRNQKLKKSKEYITVERFNEYFQIPESLDLNQIDKNSKNKLKKDSSSHEIELFDIEEEYLFILKDLYDTIPRIYQNYIVANDFINLALKDPQVLAISDEMCRIQSVETKIPVETIKSTLLRMRKQCDEYATWDDLKTYFSRRGRPLDWDFQLIQKKKEIRQEQLKVNASAIKNASIMQQQEMTLSRPSFQLSGKNNHQKNSSLEKYTIPKPFNITDQIKKKETSTKKLTSEELEIEELKKKFKAKSVNAEILESKPDLIQGKLGKSQEKSSVYNYENYENDRIQRLLKKAQEQFEDQEKLKQIKRLTEVKAKQVKIDLNKKLDDVVKEQKRIKEKTKPKPTVPQVSPNLYPENPKEEAKKKLEKTKEKLEKGGRAAQIRQELKKGIKDKAKERNDKIKQTAKEKKKRDEQQKEELAKLTDNSQKPKINKRNTTQQQKQALKKARQDRQSKKLQEQQALMQIDQKKRQSRLKFIKPQSKLEIQSLQDQQIFNRIDEVDLEDILLDEHDKIEFRKEFQLKNKTRKEIKDRFNGQAGRQRAAMQAEQKRLAEQKRELKEKKQSKLIKQKIEQAKELKNEVTTTMNVDTNFHRSNALRRYRALMQGKQPNSEYDQYSRAGDLQRNDI